MPLNFFVPMFFIVSDVMVNFAVKTRPKVLFVDSLDAEIVKKALKEARVDVLIVSFKKIPGFISFDEIMAAQNADEVAHFRCTSITSPETPAMILFSSGTTAGPKGVVISYGALARTEPSVPSAPRASHTCMILTIVPWVSFIVYFLEATLLSATIVLSFVPNDKTYSAIEKYKVWTDCYHFEQVGIKTNLICLKCELRIIK